MENNFDSNVISHSVKVLERSNIFISGTKKVHNFNENEFLINTVMGNINIKGSGLELIKLDTNGSNPKVLKELIDKNLIDYVAMDIKNDFACYSDVTKTNVNIEKIKESINILKESKIEYEFRTTIIKNFHNLNKIKQIYQFLGKEEKYYLQNFKDSEGVLDKNLFSFSDIELKELKNNLEKEFPNLIIRGI